MKFLQIFVAISVIYTSFATMEAEEDPFSDSRGMFESESEDESPYEPTRMDNIGQLSSRYSKRVPWYYLNLMRKKSDDIKKSNDVSRLAMRILKRAPFHHPIAMMYN